MNHDSHQRPSVGRLESAVDSLRKSDVSGVPDDLIQRTAVALGQASRRRDWRTRGYRFVAATTAALVLLGIGVTLLQSSPSRVLAEMAQRVKETKSLRARLTDPGGQGRLLISGTRRRLDRDDGAIILADSASHRELIMDTNQKSAMRGSLAAVSPALDFYGIFRELADASAAVDEYLDKAGRHYPGVSGEATLRFDRNVSLKARATVWSDPKSKLPVRLKIAIPEAGKNAAILLEDIEFDVSLDDSLFQMMVPDDYSATGMFPDQLKPAPNGREAAKLMIVPGVGIGEAKFGMSREQIVAVLGEPEFVIGETCLCYPSKGLQLCLVGREPDRLGMIIANPMDYATRTRNEFPGQTDKGIRIGSSEQEVLDTYGEPDPLRPGEHAPSERVGVASYGELGLQYRFVEGKVQQIITARTD